MLPEPRACESCRRPIQWRQKWARDWTSVKYCSAACRRHDVTDVDRRLEDVILDLLAKRGRPSTICPSEAARAVGGDEEEAWRALMEPARRAARRLVARGEVEITQGGRVVEESTARGPVRIRRR